MMVTSGVRPARPSSDPQPRSRAPSRPAHGVFWVLRSLTQSSGQVFPLCSAHTHTRTHTVFFPLSFSHYTHSHSQEPVAPPPLLIISAMIASSGRAGADCGLSPLSAKVLGESLRYSSDSKGIAHTVDSAVHFGRVSSIDSEPDSEYEDELMFDDLDSPSPDTAGSSEGPSASAVSSSGDLSPTDRYIACAHRSSSSHATAVPLLSAAVEADSLPSYTTFWYLTHTRAFRIARHPNVSLMHRPSLSSVPSASTASWSSRFNHTAFATSPPAMSSFTYSSSAPAFASTSAATAGHSAQVSPEEYLDFMSASTRNVTKRRQRADIHRRASGAPARPKLSQLEEEAELDQYRQESACMHCGGQPSSPSTGDLLSHLTAFSLPPPTSLWSAEAFDTTTSQPVSSALLAAKLAHVAGDVEHHPTTELGRRSSRHAQASPRSHRDSSSRGRHPRTNGLDETLERALTFANWSKRGRAGVWQPPLDASQSLVDLVAALEDRE